jgi:hypothetical protein
VTGVENHQLRGRGNENVEIYIPVFEAKDIHVMTFEKGAKVDRLVCPDDVALNCTIASMMFTQTKVFSYSRSYIPNMQT